MSLLRWSIRALFRQPRPLNLRRVLPCGPTPGTGWPSRRRPPPRSARPAAAGDRPICGDCVVAVGVRYGGCARTDLAVALSPLASSPQLCDTSRASDHCEARCDLRPITGSWGLTIMTEDALPFWHLPRIRQDPKLALRPPFLGASVKG